MTNKLTVERLPDGQVHVARESWHDTFPEERRIPWADWYERMHKDTGYPGYLETAKALRELVPVDR
ncbi:hypothetical protein [Thalassovita aquimarina]|nr:hypothetical protein [Thalassovita aquimarina]